MGQRNSSEIRLYGGLHNPITKSDAARMRYYWVSTTTLPKGSVLYRTQPVTCAELKATYCSDTFKTGMYFSTGKYIPLGMILEYVKPMFLCKYITTAPVKLYHGKYGFRIIEAQRFYKTLSDMTHGKFTPGITPTKSWNHIESGILPLAREFQNDVWRKKDYFDESEVFIGEEDLLKLRPIRGSDPKRKQISVKMARKVIQHKLSTLYALELDSKIGK